MKLHLWNFDEPGPINLCKRCFRPEKESDEYSFCVRCGESDGPFNEVFQTPTVFTCYYCGRSPVISYCGRCAKPICKNCNDENSGGYLLLYDGRRWNCCIHCIKKRQEIETRFLIEVHSSGKCAKHTEYISRFKCINCGLPLCEFCSYFFKNIRWFKVMSVIGPLCIICSRYNISGSLRERWTSWEEVQQNQWKFENSTFLNKWHIYKGTCNIPIKERN